MQIIAAMFDSRIHAEDAIDRLVAIGCPRDAVTFLPENELTEVATTGAYDWQMDKWGLWRGLAAFEVMSDPDRYCLVEGMHRGGSVLLVAAKDGNTAERFSTILVEAGAVDLDEREATWRAAGWKGLGTGDGKVPAQRHRSSSNRLRVY